MSDQEVGVKLEAVQAAQILNVLEKVQKELQSVGKTAQESATKTKASENIFVGAFRRIGEMATNWVGQAAQQFLGFVKTSLNSAEEYEDSMNMLATVTGASAEEMAEAGKKAQALGADLSLPATSAGSAAQAMTELAKAGLSVDDVLSAAKGTLQLAAAGNLSEAQAAEIAANALNTFALSGDHATEVANYLAAAANASSLEVTDAADAFTMAGSVFASFQGPAVGAEQAMIDLTTALGLLGNAGIKGSDAGTSLKQMLLQLAAPSDKAKGIMKELAANLGIAGDIAYDAAGNMRPLREILQLTTDATAEMTQEQRQYAISTVFGADATRSVLALIRAGPEAWDKMAGSITATGAAGTLANARMMGLSGAVQAITSQVETLMLEAMLPLLPVLGDLAGRAAEFLGGFAGQVGPIMQTLVDTLIQAGDVISTLFMPAVVGVTAATIAWAIASSGNLGVALALVVQRVIIATEAIVANAAAVALAALPYVAIGAALGVAYLKFQAFNQQVEDATTALLESHPFWRESSKILEDFSQASEDVQQKFKGLADAVRANREHLQYLIEDLGKRKAAGIVSDAQFEEEMTTINAWALAVQVSSQQLENATQAELRLQAAQVTGTEQLNATKDGLAGLGEQANLTAEDLLKLQEAVEKNFQSGAEAVAEYATTSMEFNGKLTEAIKAGNQEQTLSLLNAYAQQAAAQRQHLGQMLSEYTVAQVELGNITREKGGEVLDAIVEQFGSQDASAAQAYLRMTGYIDKYAKDGKGSLADLGEAVTEETNKVITLREKSEALAKKYEMELLANFDEKTDDAEELKRALEDIPRRVQAAVNIEVTIEEIHKNLGGTGAGGGSGGLRAEGGPVYAGNPFTVGELGPETFIPSSNGYIMPSSANQIYNSNTYAPSVSTTTTNQYNYSPTYGQTPRQPRQDFMIMEALNK